MAVGCDKPEKNCIPINALPNKRIENANAIIKVFAINENLPFKNATKLYLMMLLQIILKKKQSECYLFICLKYFIIAKNINNKFEDQKY